MDERLGSILKGLRLCIPEPKTYIKQVSLRQMFGKAEIFQINSFNLL